MRVGRLSTLAKLINNQGIVLANDIFIGITEPDDYANFGQGLMSTERTTIRCRWQEGDLIQRGTWLKTDTGRLFLVQGFVAYKAQQDIVIGAREAHGYQATFTDSEGNKTHAVVGLLSYVVKPSEGNGFLPVQERRRAEFANAEHRPAPGQEFTANGSEWRLTEIDADGSSELTTRVWLEFLKHEQQ